MHITWLGHASFKVKTAGKIIYIDPYSGNYDEKADIILISHGHYDHMSIDIINRIRANETIILSTKEVAAELDSTVIVMGHKKRVQGIEIEAVAAYNIGKGFHHKDNSLGFIIKSNKKHLYFAGDTDLIPEMDKIKADLALLPIGGTYTMDAREAAEAIKIIKPKMAIPMHYGSGVVGTKEDAHLFKELVESKTDTQVGILKKGETITL